MKKCYKCKLKKDRSEFFKDKSRKDGLTSACKKCCTLQARQWDKANPEKVKNRNRQWQKEHPDKAREKATRWRKHNKKKAQAASVEWNKNNPHKMAEYKRKTKYGLTSENYHKLLNIQNGVCAICEKPETKIRNNKVLSLSVDHDHKTGKIRGLLCHRCNVALGLLDHNSQIIFECWHYINGLTPYLSLVIDNRND